MSTDDEVGMPWMAHITVSCQSDGWMHVIAKVRGETANLAKIGAETILDVMAKGKSAFVRVQPKGDTEKDFVSGTTTHHGYVRFSFSNEDGEWKFPEVLPQNVSLRYSDERKSNG